MWSSNDVNPIPLIEMNKRSASILHAPCLTCHFLVLMLPTSNFLSTIVHERAARAKSILYEDVWQRLPIPGSRRNGEVTELTGRLAGLQVRDDSPVVNSSGPICALNVESNRSRWLSRMRAVEIVVLLRTYSMIASILRSTCEPHFVLQRYLREIISCVDAIRWNLAS